MRPHLNAKPEWSFQKTQYVFAHFYIYINLTPFVDLKYIYIYILSAYIYILYMTLRMLAVSVRTMHKR